MTALMTAPDATAPPIETLADLVRRLGDVPLERIRMQPPPGTATEADLLVQRDGVKRLCELVDGVLVEKPMGYYESLLAGILIQILWNFLEHQNLGIVLGADATLRLVPGLVRLPDVSFISWDRFPNRSLPDEPVPDLTPDIAVEVLSKNNTEAEMQRKLREYFTAGTRLVWLVDPRSRTARTYTKPEEHTLLHEDDALDGGAVLPGFRLVLREWLDRVQPPPSPDTEENVP